MTIAILALQGAFAEHARMLDRLDTTHFEIRRPSDLERPFDGLILPGGESTVMGKLLQELALYKPLKELIQSGLPVFGTCAGLILLAKEVEGGTVHFGTMDIAAKRNAYGRQLGSFHTEADFTGIGTVPMTFIRAPYMLDFVGNLIRIADFGKVFLLKLWRHCSNALFIIKAKPCLIQHLLINVGCGNLNLVQRKVLGESHYQGIWLIPCGTCSAPDFQALPKPLD